MKMIKKSQSIADIKATLKRFDEEESALKEELSNYSKKWHKLHLKRAQAVGRLKKAQMVSQ